MDFSIPGPAHSLQPRPGLNIDEKDLKLSLRKTAEVPFVYDIENMDILKAYERSRLSGIVSPGLKRSASSNAQYIAVIHTLKKKSEMACPFDAFIRTDFNKMSKSTYYKYKAALQNHAVTLLKKSGPALLEKIVKADNIESVRKHFRIEDHEISDANIYMREHEKDVLKAAFFLNNFSPLLVERTENLKAKKSGLYESHTNQEKRKQIFSQWIDFLKAQNTPSPNGEVSFDIDDENYLKKKKKTDLTVPDIEFREIRSKRKTVARLNAIDKRLGDSSDWRERFFKSLSLLDDKKRDDRRSQIAVMTLTGCRPAELVKGVQVYLEKSPRSETVSLVFKIAGAKVTDFTQKQDDKILEELSLKERVLYEKLSKDSRHATQSEKGHEFRYIRVQSQSLEAKYLKDLLLEKGSNPPALLDSFVDTIKENALIRTHKITPAKAGKLNMSDPKAIVKVVDHMSSWIEYHAKQLFPRLKPKVSAYCFRHQFSSDVKAYTKDYEIRAAALGQISERTQTRYGHARAGKPKTKNTRFDKLSFLTTRSVRKNY